MKRTLIGCCLTLAGVIGYLAVSNFAANNLVSGWPTPPGRFMYTIINGGMIFPFLLSLVFLIVGLIIMAVEFFKN